MLGKFTKLELCIADDASDDSEVKLVLEEFANSDSRIKLLLRELNGHISEASNSALSLATGQYLVFLDHDDMIRPHALLRLAETLQQNPELCLIYSDEDKIDDKVHEPIPV